MSYWYSPLNTDINMGKIKFGKGENIGGEESELSSQIDYYDATDGLHENSSVIP
jgi:hypothetical protein